MHKPEAYSVVIPAFNVERFIGPALDSILSQSIPPERIIVVDDGSTDRTGEIAAGYGAIIELVRQENQGQGAATTTGIARVTTPLVAFIDADDLWLPGKIDLQLRRMEKDDLEAVFAHLYFMYDGQEPDTSMAFENWNRTTLVMRTASFRRVGQVLDMPALHGDMIEWVDRARFLSVRMAMMPEAVSIRRIREGSVTYRRGGAHGYLTAIKMALDRRRAAGSAD